MFLLVISVNHTITRFRVAFKLLLTGKSAGLFKPTNLVNCRKTMYDVISMYDVYILALLKCQRNNKSYSIHLRSANVFLQLTHSMLPLSLLILGCYTCSIYRWHLTSIATYEGTLHYMSRDNGSILKNMICNIECDSATSKPRTICIWQVNIIEQINIIEVKWQVKWISLVKWDKDVADNLDLYSHQYPYGHCFVTIKTISNTLVSVTKNIIIPFFNGTGTVFPVMIILAIRDSLREYKSNYVILSSIKLSLYFLFILSESAIFYLLFWSSYQHILSPLFITLNLWIMIILLNSYDLSLKNTNLLSNSAIIFGYHYIIGTSLGLNQWYLCSIIFMEGQLNEFTNLAINMNDTLLGWVLYNIDGWHLYHIVVGNILLILAFNLWSCTQYFLYKIVYQLRVRLHHMFYNMQLVYWHFVELLWLVIYYVVYS